MVVGEEEGFERFARMRQCGAEILGGIFAEQRLGGGVERVEDVCGRHVCGLQGRGCEGG